MTRLLCRVLKGSHEHHSYGGNMTMRIRAIMYGIAVTVVLLLPTTVNAALRVEFWDADKGEAPVAVRKPLRVLFWREPASAAIHRPDTEFEPECADGTCDTQSPAEWVHDNKPRWQRFRRFRRNR